MPALTQRTINIGKTSFFWRAFRPCGQVAEEDRVLLPAGIGDSSGDGKLDIKKVKDFFRGSKLSIDDMKIIRSRKIVEKDVKSVFDAYCAQLDAKKVVYHYNAEATPFDSSFKSESNCMGRARGFLQLMAMLGVSVDNLALCQIGGQAGEEDKKVCQGGEDSNDRSVYTRQGAPAPEDAPNAVKIKLRRSGKLVVSRTPREPFANHYAAHLNIPGLTFKCWDPLLNAAYPNGFRDLFTTYAIAGSQLTLDLTTWHRIGLKCLVNPDNIRERIYILPPSSKMRGSQTGEAFFDQPAFKAVETQLSKMQDQEPCVAVIIDEKDWGGESGSHPPVIRAMAAE